MQVNGGSDKLFALGLFYVTDPVSTGLGFTRWQLRRQITVPG